MSDNTDALVSTHPDAPVDASYGISKRCTRTHVAESGLCICEGF